MSHEEHVQLTFAKAAASTIAFIHSLHAGLGSMSSSCICALAALSDGESHRMAFLSKKAGVSSAAMTGIKDQLCRKELATEFQTEGDRRSVSVRATAKGTRILCAANEAGMAAAREVEEEWV